MKQWWRHIVRDYLTFTAAERNGLLVLCGLLLGVIFIPQLKEILEPAADFSHLVKEIDSLQKPGQEELLGEAASKGASPKRERKEMDSLFPFDPNVVTKEELSRLGFSAQAIANLEKYRLAGGKFYNKEDLKKIYGVDIKQFAAWEPFIQLGDEQPSESFPMKKTPQSNGTSYTVHFPLIDLNTADSSELEMLPGVGPVLAARIIRYRAQLGGFHSVDQLSEVYGMRPTLVKQLKKHVTATQDGIQCIDINKATMKELYRHPYIRSWSRLIVRYREQHGPFSSLDDLLKIDPISEDLVARWKPYLCMQLADSSRYWLDEQQIF